VKGFSARNIDRMLAFYREYPDLGQAFSPPAVAKMPPAAKRIQSGSPVADPAAETDPTISPPPAARSPRQTEQLPVAQLPWAHNVLLLQKVKDRAARRWYMDQTLINGWSRDVLAAMIDARTHDRQGQVSSTFATRLPAPQSDLAQQTLKDPYLFDFLTLDEPFHERELETGLVRHLEKFLIELGQGFAFAGRQDLVSVGGEDFYIDLLFYHLRLRCFIVIELKRGRFKPEYAGKINFYCNIVDDHLKHFSDQPTIGLILCQAKDKVVAEYALRGMNKPIGVSEFELTRALPDSLKSTLPTIEEIEAELQSELEEAADEP
jgi:predicted nuclease of restriction endonuclease-like (RecB) superfamily